MTTTSPTSTSCITPETSASDNRQYKYLTLEHNELKILLISDKHTEKAAAGLDVNVGSYSDNLGGEAHFLEHMLFMGTTKYPNENDYNEYLNKHGGSSNAYTDLEHTNYYLDVSCNYLEGALDRFAQFFIAPLLKSDALDRERKAVDSEHAKNLQSDMWRQYQLLKSLSRKDHAFSKFGTGNLESLEQVTQESLTQFYETHYSSNNMSLVVLGKESLEKLEALVTQYFSDIPNRSLPKKIFPGEPFRGILPLQLQVIPVKQATTLELQFPMRSLETLYRSKPSRYLSHLLGHESKGSLLALLKEKQWAHDLSAGTTRSCSDWSGFGIQIALTDQGFEHYNEIVSLVFSYIRMLQQEGPAQKWIHDEIKTVADCSFRFLSKRDAMDYVSSLATNLHMYEPEHVLSGDYRYYDYDPTHITECLSYMVPSNLLLSISHPKAFEDVATDKEQWYGVQYKATSIADDLIYQWTGNGADITASIPVELHLPERNDMIATNFDIKAEQKVVADSTTPDATTSTSTTTEPPTSPLLLTDTPTSRLWYKADTHFAMPKVNWLIQILTPVAYESPRSQVLTQLWQKGLEEACNDFSYLASMAGLHCQFHTTRSGIEIHLSGYNDKVDKLVQRIVHAMTNMETSLTEQVMDRLRSKLKQDLENFNYAQAYQHAMFGADMVLMEYKWTPAEKMVALQNVTRQQVIDFGTNQLLQNCQLEMLIHGNVNKDEARKLGKMWIDGLSPEAPFRLPEDRIVQLPPKRDTVMRFAGFNPENTNSVVDVIYQIGVLSLEERAHLAFIQHVLKEPAFNQLRTEEQLGYIVHTSIQSSGSDIKGLLLLIQSDAYDPIHLDSRVQFFMEGFRAKLVDGKDFEQNIQAVVHSLREKPKNLLEESTHYWDAISKRHYGFQRMHEIATLVETKLTPTSVVQFYDKYLAADTSPRFSVQVFGSNHKDKLEEALAASDGSEACVTMESALEFKRTSQLFPFAPAVSVSKDESA